MATSSFFYQGGLPPEPSAITQMLEALTDAKDSANEDAAAAAVSATDASTSASSASASASSAGTSAGEAASSASAAATSATNAASSASAAATSASNAASSATDAATSASNAAVAVSFSHSGSYAGGTVGSKLKQSVSVKDAPYNAVGDGVVDDTAALDAAAAHIISTGGRLFLPPGTYNHNGPWTLTGSNFIVEGCGESSVIVNTNTTTNLSKTMAVVGDNIVLRDFCIDGKKTTVSGAGLTERTGLDARGNNLLIEGIKAYDTLTQGILAGVGRNVRVLGCTVRDVGYFGGHQNALGIMLTSVTQASVVGCHAYNTARTGIFVYLSEAVAVTGNSVDSCENGIRVDVGGNHRSVIAGNVACRGTGDGIRFTGNNVTVSGNSCFANGGSGLNSEGGTEQTVTGNTSIGNTQNGLRVGSAVGATSRLTISGNTLTGNTSSGVFLTPSTSAATDVTVVGNNLVGNGDRALRLGAAGAASTLYFGENNYGASGTDSVVLSATNWTASSPGNYRGTIASASTITVFGKGTYGISGTADITNITIQPVGTVITLYFVATAASLGLVNGTGNLRIGSNFVYANNATITLVSTGTTWLQVTRSLN